jgi:GNAT superfamily N-acetyltransferase
VSALAARLPDLPRLVETRAMLLSGACEVIGDTAAGDYVVCSADAGVAAVVGHPSAAALRAAAERTGIIDVLCPEATAGEVAGALPGWAAQAAVIHTLSGAPAHRGAARADVRVLEPDEDVPVVHLPADLRDEFARARRHPPLVAALVDGRAVAFAYVPWQTETLCDLSIDTAPGYRRRGLAAAASARLIDEVRRLGKQPVWGAVADNRASLALARRLGFTAVDRLVVLSRPQEG